VAAAYNLRTNMEGHTEYGCVSLLSDCRVASDTDTLPRLILNQLRWLDFLHQPKVRSPQSEGCVN
jgi:hypothetical protein